MNKQTRKFIWGLIILFTGTVSLLLAVLIFTKGQTINWIIQSIFGIFQISLAVYRIEDSVNQD
jgi:succinate-acetate transporter protein